MSSERLLIYAHQKQRMTRVRCRKGQFLPCRLFLFFLVWFWVAKAIRLTESSADFIRAFALGFRVEDAVALLRLDNLWIETFE